MKTGTNEGRVSAYSAEVDKFFCSCQYPGP
jgi:hypothetical protein